MPEAAVMSLLMPNSEGVLHAHTSCQYRQASTTVSCLFTHPFTYQVCTSMCSPLVYNHYSCSGATENASGQRKCICENMHGELCCACADLAPRMPFSESSLGSAGRWSARLAVG